MLLLREAVNIEYAKTIFITVATILFVVVSWIMFPHVVKYLVNDDEHDDYKGRMVQLLQMLLLLKH